MKRQNLAVIINSDINTPKKISSEFWRSAEWYVSEKTAQTLVGGLFSIHTKQKEDSHHQGIVEGYEKVSEGRYAIIYRYIKGSVSGKSLPSWSQEMAIY
jgi:hypothetical protein